MYRSVTIQTNAQLGTITISSKPEASTILLCIACLIGLCSLPFTEYHNDYLAYVGLLFVLGLTVYYAIISRQSAIFENKTHIRVRKGLDSWDIPFEAVTGGYTSYNESVSRQSLVKTHYLDFELQVNSPDNHRRWIRNGKANIFHYGFNQWGREQEIIRKKFNAILEEQGIPNLAPE